MGKKTYGGTVELAQLSDKFQGKELRFPPPAARLSVSVSEYGKMAFVHLHKNGKNLSLSVPEYFTFKKAAPRIEKDIAISFASIKNKGLLPKEEECDQLSSVSIDECLTAMEKPHKVKKIVKKKRKIEDQEEEDVFPVFQPPKKSKMEDEDPIPKKLAKKKANKTQSEQVAKIINDSHKEEEAFLNEGQHSEDSEEEE